jgi:hypothetical protein
MARSSGNRCALRVAWTFPPADVESANTVHARLTAGQKQRLFDLRSWEVHDGKACALLAPRSPLEEIVALIWDTAHQPVPASLVWLE